MVSEITAELLKQQIRNIPDFPRKGIQFKDITTLLKQPALFSYAVDTIAEKFKNQGITKVVCVESRGFMLGGALAYKLGAGFVPVRKNGKLPAQKLSMKYNLEYGMDSIEIHHDALSPEDTILLHDDLLATGGTAAAAVNLVRLLEPRSIHVSFLCELDFLNGREKLKDLEVFSLVHF